MLLLGGVPASGANSTGCQSVNTILTGKTTNPIVNLSGCPVHPTILIQSLLDLILIGNPAVDSNNRPTKYYSTIHSTCPRRGTQTGVPIGSATGCFRSVGCKGPSTQNICPSMKWNNGQAWCIGVNYPCIGCSNPTFPTSPLL